MTEQAVFCRLNVSEAEIRVSGLQNKWPRRVTRYLAPLDFQQQNDNRLSDLLGVFERVPQANH